MRLKIVLWLMATSLLANVSFAHAQQPAKLPKLGWLAASSSVTPSGTRPLFMRELNKLGYVDGKNIAIESRHADNQLDRLPALAAELVRLKVELLITGGSNAALAAKNATKTIPIVFFNLASDPVTLGLVDSLARPGGNITGFTTISGMLGGKRLEILKETIPKLSRVAVLWDPKNLGSAEQWKESQQPARELGLQLHSMEVSSADKLESAFKAAIDARSTALTVTQIPLITNRRKQVADLATKYRLPALYNQSEFVENGGLMSYGTDQTESFRRAAAMVDKVLKGTKPADIPVEQAMRFEFVINLKTAKQIGFTVPPEILARANKIIR